MSKASYFMSNVNDFINIQKSNQQTFEYMQTIDDLVETSRVLTAWLDPH